MIESALLERKFPDCGEIHGAEFHGVVVVHGVVFWMGEVVLMAILLVRD